MEIPTSYNEAHQIEKSNDNSNSNKNLEMDTHIKSMFHALLLEEIFSRVQKGDIIAFEIVTIAKRKLKANLDNYKEITKYTLIAIKPIFLAFLVDSILVEPLQI